MRRRRSSSMEKAFLGAWRLAGIFRTSRFSDKRNRTPYGLDVSLPNKERGTFHIEKGNYWKFYNLEYACYLNFRSCRLD
jgi:hypothetical protein